MSLLALAISWQTAYYLGLVFNVAGLRENIPVREVLFRSSQLLLYIGILVVCYQRILDRVLHRWWESHRRE
jgi:hypothetical protein